MAAGNYSTFTFIWFHFTILTMLNRQQLRTFVLASLVAFFGVSFTPAAPRPNAASTQDQTAESRDASPTAQAEDVPRLLIPPHSTRPRRVGKDLPRQRSIRRAFRQAGESVVRGGKRFGGNIAEGRVVRAGKELGLGAGGFGKHSAVGVARTGKRVGRRAGQTAERVFTP